MKTKMLGLAACLLGLGLSGPARADVLGSGLLELTNLKLVDAVTNQPLTVNVGNPAAGDLQIFFFVDSSTDLTILDAVAASGFANRTFPDATPVDMPRVCLGDCTTPPTPPENDNLPNLPPPAGDYAVGDTLLSGAVVDIVPAGGGLVPAGVDALVRGDASLVTTTPGTLRFGTVQAGLTSNSSFMNVTGAPITAKFIADYLVDATAVLSDPANVGESVNATTSWVATISGGLLDWTPPELQWTAALNFPDMGLEQRPGSFGPPVGNITSPTFTLAPNVAYTLGIGHQVIINITKTQIPEPSVILLLGTGVLGLAMARRRRKSA